MKQIRVFAVTLLLAATAVAQQGTQPAAGAPAKAQAGQAQAAPAQPQQPATAAAPQAPPSIGGIMDRQLTNLEKGFVAMAEAMPEEKYAFKPSGEGEFEKVRTFGQQVRHVATANYMLASAALNEKPPVDIGNPMQGQDGPASLSTKADIVRYLKDSFAHAHKAMQAISDESKAVQQVPSPFGQGKGSRLGFSSMLLWHMMDHYGQMAVYLRMNNIVPPASRQQ